MPPLDFDDHRSVDREHHDSPCRNCDVVREIAFCADLGGEEMRRLAAVRCHAHLPASFAVFREGDPADHLYSISSGAVKLYKLLSDGRRQIIGFLFSGDMFGLGVDGGYAYTAETVTPTQLCRFTHRKLDGLLQEVPRLERKMYAMAVKDLVAAQEQMLLLGRKTAKEKVATFLLKLSRRAETLGQPVSSIALPMSRADIADYLGLTIETVSRTFTQLKREGVIGLPASGHVVVMDAAGLKDLAEGSAA
ncbi:MAG TPA: helix-turn-helix domain-containing protein [Candidatus Omnitrophota bacterium]|nr:helix-turn-helix domain-containing protein [Candidatus Omnitrophota bacterium]